MIRAIIIDDEQHCIDALLSLTKSHGDMFNILGCYKTVEDGIKATKNFQPDLVFLDVEIGNKTGFDYLEQLGTINFHVVFTTAFDKYAVKAFKFNALHYLLKPIDSDDFNETIVKIKEASLKDISMNIGAFIHNLKAEKTEKRISINTTEDCIVLAVSDILYCQSQGNYTDIFTVKEKKIRSSKTLKIFDDLLSDEDFYRVDQSFLINLKYVSKYTKGKPAYAIMNNGDKIKVSLSNKEGFLQKLINLS